MILKTERLILRELIEDDAGFILELFNTDDWKKNIGDRNINLIEEARDYIVNGPIKSYAEHGFGLSLVALKPQFVPIGICGLLKRDSLEDPDIGFALLPEYYRQGFGYEIASATLKHASEEWAIPKVSAITIPENTASIRLLEKLNLKFQKKIQLKGESVELLLFRTNIDKENVH
jgi:RimJ/RimL family protein N-acetyltransferase